MTAPNKQSLPSSLYSPHPSLAMEEAIVKNLKTKTGKTIEEWVDLIQKSGPSSEQERRTWLKSNYQLTTNYAWYIAECASKRRGREAYHPEAYVKAMFAGKKAPLFPLYEQLLMFGFALGSDVKACPCKTIVPLYRKHVFAQLKPSTQKRLDLGLALKTTKPEGRLISTGGLEKGDRITHRIPITSMTEIDDEVEQWFKAAYEMNP